MLADGAQIAGEQRWPALRCQDPLNKDRVIVNALLKPDRIRDKWKSEPRPNVVFTLSTRVDVHFNVDVLDETEGRKNRVLTKVKLWRFVLRVESYVWSA